MDAGVRSSENHLEAPIRGSGGGLGGSIDIPVFFEALPELDLILVVECDLAASLETLRATDDGLTMRLNLEVVAYWEDPASEFTEHVS